MNRFLKSFLVLIFIISVPLIFFGCTKKEKKLITPISVGLVHNYDANNELEEPQILLVTDENEKATGYRFYLTVSSDYENLNNYVSYYSETNYLDITDIYNEKQTYHYFVQYIGDNKNFINSDYSIIKKEVGSKEKIINPYIQLIDEKLYFFRIMNAKNYELYETITDTNSDIVVQQNTKIQTLDSETFEIDLSNRFNEENAPYYTFSYKLKAIGDTGYLNSDFSNTVSYVKHITLNKVKNLQVNENENKYYLTWNAVDYATKYKVLINNDTDNPIITTENSLEITNKLTNYATYNFSVQAIESEALDYDLGERSEILEYDFTTTLASPDNLNATRNGEYINVTFDNVDLAQSYVLEILYNGTKVYNIENLTLNNASIEIVDLFDNLNSDKEITIRVKANKIGEYIFESGYTEIKYTVLKEVVSE